MYAFRILASGVVFGKLILIAVRSDGRVDEDIDDSKQMVHSTSRIWQCSTCRITYGSMAHSR